MLNQVILVGRLEHDPEVKKSENDKDYSKMTIAIPRNFKNADGKYDTDYVEFITFGGVAKNTAAYCKKDDIIGVKGRIQSTKTDKGLELQLVAEKVSFLSTKQQENDKEKDDDQER